ncbi:MULTISPECIES: DUF2312 domain-containing protein [unclassified Aurantimonas]|uniref:DUF2312 domain-containing protein n=1 Tax=unclassified Aurantimonas TaxID=2638230 RepID=UPI002E17489E|nr:MULTISPECIES: GapR family DNA-binding domain-containing protein [unclassified Aurantimonas]MEC5291554.1 GapR family DNA-binding domain-containing protein [Aurantimonas sp. C2-3-R2]MEC5412638.1 GapR family DNA-binding domain-containing protein [Aurantimonas sp. C2-4-R8]
MTDETPGEGHNSGIAVSQMRAFAQRIIKLENDKKEAVAEFNGDIKDVKAEAKGSSFDTKALSDTIRIIRMEPEKRALLGLYCDALNVFD